MSATINNSVTLHQGRVFKLINENYTLDNGVTSDMDFIQHPGSHINQAVSSCHSGIHLGNPCRDSGSR